MSNSQSEGKSIHRNRNYLCANPSIQEISMAGESYIKVGGGRDTEDSVWQGQLGGCWGWHHGGKLLDPPIIGNQ